MEIGPLGQDKCC